MNQERLYKVLLAAVVSEKATLQADIARQFVFKVLKDSTKPEIKAAVEKRFNVKVEFVRTSVVKGKTKRTRFGVGKQSDWKKAYVKLAEGHDIDFATGM
ncbi:MAG: large subunit ribosomal protein L23 [Cellvibrionaceae bacterium]|jgi:large subunit ribosomal protein L23